MELEERVEQLEKSNTELSKKVNNLEFRIELIASPTHINQVLYEYEVNRDEYDKIMELMDSIREALENNQEYTHGKFEREMRNIFPNPEDIKHDYHFAEAVAQAFMEDGRWEEVFPALYRELPKFREYLNHKKNGVD